MNELDFQAILIKSAKRLDGHGRKISSRFQVGIPDLLLAIPGFIPTIVEAKWLGKVTSNFDVQIPTTRPQRDTLKAFNEVYPAEGEWGYVITGFYMGPVMLASMTKWRQLRIRAVPQFEEERIERLSAEKGFALDVLFTRMGVPAVNFHGVTNVPRFAV